MGGRGRSNWFVADSEGGFWTSRDEKSVAKVVGMTGGVGYGGRTRMEVVVCNLMHGNGR